MRRVHQHNCRTLPDGEFVILWACFARSCDFYSVDAPTYIPFGQISGAALLGVGSIVYAYYSRYVLQPCPANLQHIIPQWRMTSN